MPSLLRHFSPSPFWRRLTGTALLLGSLSAGPAALAQVFQPAVTSDFGIGTSIDMHNTGAEHVPLAGQTLRVMCSDGDAPQVYWSFSPDETPGNIGKKGLLSSGSKVAYDPDVVADPGGFGARGGTTTDILVVYMLNDAVCCEILQYDASTNTATNVQPNNFPANIPASLTGPVILAPASARGSNPNVDVDGNGHAVITWSQDAAKGSGKSIYVQTYDMPSRSFYTSCEIAGEPGYDCTQPDVSITHTHESIISLIYLASQNGQQTVRMTQVGRYSIELYPQLNHNNGIGVDVLPGISGSFEAPRIAAQPYNRDYVDNQLNDYNFEAVVAETSTNTIYGLNASNATGSPLLYGPLPTVTMLNSAGNLANRATCSEPVVTYCGDVINVAWTMKDDYGYTVRNGTQEIVRVLLDYNGNPMNQDYSIVNMREKNDQLTPSVAGRYAAQLAPGANATSKTLYCWQYSAVSGDLLFKSSNAGAPNLRTASSATTQQPIVAYPNPFQDETTFTLSLADKEAVQSLEVYDPMGQPVRSLKMPRAEDRGAQQVSWNAAGLKPGLYQVRVRTSAGNTYTYRVQHD